MFRKIFGLDFGTTNSALAVCYNNNMAEVIELDDFCFSGKITRSALFFNENDELFIGCEAVERYIEDVDAGRYMQSLKAFLPDKTFESTEVYGRMYKIEELISIIIRKMKIKGEEYIGESVDSIIMGRPVIFSDDPKLDELAEKRLRRAAEIAGFKNIYFQLEPVAAAFAFETNLSQDKEQLVLVGDFGGGTSDFTVIRLHGGRNRAKTSYKKDVLSIGGVYIGGDTFDSEIMWNKIASHFGKDVKIKFIMNDNWHTMPPLINKLRYWHLIPQLREMSNREAIRKLKALADRKDLIENLERLIDDNTGFMLFRAIERAKCELSYNDKTSIFFKEFSLIIKELITRKEFESIIEKEVREIKKCVENVIKNASINKQDIDAVFLTGGSSSIPCVSRILEDMFGQPKICKADLFTSVAYGLGISSFIYF